MLASIRWASGSVAGAHTWSEVLAVSEELAELDLSAADPDGLASAAREQLARQREAEREAERAAQQANVVSDQPVVEGKSFAARLFDKLFVIICYIVALVGVGVFAVVVSELVTLLWRWLPLLPP